MPENSRRRADVGGPSNISSSSETISDPPMAAAAPASALVERKVARNDSLLASGESPFQPLPTRNRAAAASNPSGTLEDSVGHTRLRLWQSEAVKESAGPAIASGQAVRSDQIKSASGSQKQNPALQDGHFAPETHSQRRVQGEATRKRKTVEAASPSAGLGQPVSARKSADSISRREKNDVPRSGGADSIAPRVTEEHQGSQPLPQEGLRGSPGDHSARNTPGAETALPWGSTKKRTRGSGGAADTREAATNQRSETTGQVQPSENSPQGKSKIIKDLQDEARRKDRHIQQLGDKITSDNSNISQLMALTQRVNQELLVRTVELVSARAEVQNLQTSQVSRGHSAATLRECQRRVDTEVRRLTNSERAAIAQSHNLNGLLAQKDQEIRRLQTELQSRTQQMTRQTAQQVEDLLQEQGRSVQLQRHLLAVDSRARDVVRQLEGGRHLTTPMNLDEAIRLVKTICPRN